MSYNNGKRYNGGYNRNYNGNRNNNGYRYNGNGYNKRYDNRPANDYVNSDRQYSDVLDFTQNRKKPILIVDMNGNRYEISGNFTSEFLAAMSRVANKYLEYQKVLKSKNPDPAIFGELFDLMKDWCLMLINMNTSGETYTMANINAGFNDYEVLVAVFAFINDRIKTTNIKLDNDQNG